MVKDINIGDSKRTNKMIDIFNESFNKCAVTFETREMYDTSTPYTHTSLLGHMESIWIYMGKTRTEEKN